MLRWAILGTGFISNTVAEAINRSSGSQLVAIAGRNVEAVDRFATAHGVAKRYTGYTQVFSDPDIDALYIGTPNHVHCEQAIAGIANGKVVLSEKSLTCDMDDAQRLAAVVRSGEQFFVEGLMYLAHPLYQRVSDVLKSGVLGELRSVSGFYSASIEHVVNPKGRGTLYNLGCYPVSLLQYVVQTLCGDNAFRTRRLVGVGNLNADKNICDAAVSVCFENGVLATLQSSDSYGSAHSFHIVGSTGALEFLTNPWPTGVQSCRLRLHRYVPAGESKRSDALEPEIIDVDDPYDAFYHQITAVEERVAAGDTQARRPSPTIEDSLEIMAFLTDWEASVLARR